MLFDQIDRQRPQPGTVLRPARSLSREGPHADRLAGGAAHVQCLILADDQPQGRQLVDLTALTQDHWRIPVQHGLAACAARRPLLHHRVGLLRRHQVQRRPVMAHLAAGLLATLAPQALGLPCEPVARRRFATVVAILGEAPLQLLDTRQ